MQYAQGNGAAAAAGEDSTLRGQDERTGDSLRSETVAVAGALTGFIRDVGATAKTEAGLSFASITAVLAAAMISLLLAVTAWLCFVAAAVWLAVDRGIPAGGALLGAGVLHVLIVLGLFLWSKSLLRNVGFERTRRLVFSRSPSTSSETSR
jgi:hypothetical protein